MNEVFAWSSQYLQEEIKKFLSYWEGTNFN